MKTHTIPARTWFLEYFHNGELYDISLEKPYSMQQINPEYNSYLEL